MEKILDCSSMSDFQFTSVKQGFDAMVNNVHKHRYFGYVDKVNLKDILRTLHYTDKRSFVKGGLFVTGVIIAGKAAKHLIEKKLAEKEKEEEES